MTWLDSMTDEQGLCLRCGHSLDTDGSGHSDDCPWGA